VITNAQKKTVRCPWADCGAIIHFNPPRPDGVRYPLTIRAVCEQDHPVLLTFVAFGLPPVPHPDRSRSQADGTPLGGK
jgi:hypothetical protein